MLEFNGVLLFKAENPEGDNPHYLGTCNIKGVRCRIGGWLQPGGSIKLKFQTEQQYDDIKNKLEADNADG